MLKFQAFKQRALYTEELMRDINKFLSSPNIAVESTHMVADGNGYVVVGVFYHEH